MTRAGQNHIYTVCIGIFWQGNHQIYGHIRCIYTVLANPIYDRTHGHNPPLVIPYKKCTHICRVGQNRICTPYMTVCMVISLLKIPYVHRMYL